MPARLQYSPAATPSGPLVLPEAKRRSSRVITGGLGMPTHVGNCSMAWLGGHVRPQGTVGELASSPDPLAWSIVLHMYHPEPSP